MSVQDFDPDKFINCDVERQLFAEMLTFADLARVLTVSGPSGTGKSLLLRSFAHQCRIARPRIPVALISLDQPGDAILPLIQAMERQLSIYGLEFPAFKRLESARAAKDFGPFRSSVYLEGASFKGSRGVQISGTMINSERVEHMTVRAEQIEFSAEQVSLAQEVSVSAFFDDLRACCARTPIVLLLDTFEKVRPQLHTWLHDYYLERFFFDSAQRPAKLITVIAGQETPAFPQFWPRDLCEAMVRTVPQLSAWEREHIEAYCIAHGLAPQLAPIDPIYQIVQSGGMTPELIKNVINTLLSQTRPR